MSRGRVRPRCEYGPVTGLCLHCGAPWSPKLRLVCGSRVQRRRARVAALERKARTAQRIVRRESPQPQHFALRWT